MNKDNNNTPRLFTIPSTMQMSSHLSWGKVMHNPGELNTQLLVTVRWRRENVRRRESVRMWRKEGEWGGIRMSNECMLERVSIMASNEVRKKMNQLRWHYTVQYHVYCNGNGNDWNDSGNGNSIRNSRYNNVNNKFGKLIL